MYSARNLLIRARLAGLVLLLTIGCVASPPAPAPAPPVVSQPTAPTRPAAGPAAPIAAPAFTASQARQVVDELAGTIGPRPAGSEAYQRAADFAAARFREFGYQVERQPFTFSVYQVNHVELRQLGPAEEAIETRPLENSAGGRVEGTVVVAGVGRSSEFPASVRGNIALIARGADIPFADKVAAAVTAGATGVIISNNQPGTFTGTAGRRTAIPVVTVSKEVGDGLRQQLAAGEVTARIIVDATSQEIASENVIATRPGSGPLVIAGGHLDSVAPSPGANDNASGSATVIELARSLAGQPLAGEVRFILFGAEENGLIGSRRYVERLDQADRDRLRGMLNLDMVGVGDRFRIGGNARLVETARSVADSLGQPVTDLPNSLAGASDHASFNQAGLPAAFFHWTEDPDYHAPTDRPTNIRLDRLQSTGDVVLGTILALMGE